MSKSIIISERDNIAAVVKDGKVIEFFIHRGEILLGDIFLAKVENVLPSIDAAFVNVGSDKMGFLHASDIIGKGALNEIVKPKQNLIVQVVKEPTGHKGPRVTTSITIPGRFLVLMPQEKGVNVSKKISSAKERARLKSIVSVMKTPGIGIIIRTEAENQSEAEIQEDLELLLESWHNVVTAADTVNPPSLLHRDQDLLYKVIREACTEDVSEIVVDTSFAYYRAQQLLQSWNISHPVNLSLHKGKDSILIAHNIDKEIRNALQTKINLPCGGYLYIQTTEALSVIDVNSGKFVSSATQAETIRKTNLEAVDEIARQLKLRNIGGMIIVDFIDMDNRVDQIMVLEQFELALEPDKSNPQIGQLSDLGLVELTRHRQGQSLAEIFSKKCSACSGTGMLLEEFNFVVPPQEAEMAVKQQKTKHFRQGAMPMKQSGQDFTKQFQNNPPNKPNAFLPKRIEASPSINAANAHKIIKNRPEELKPQEINNDSIKQHLQQNKYLPNISQVVKFSSVPSGAAKNNMGEDYQPDVFTLLDEIETTDTQAKQPPQQEQLLIELPAQEIRQKEMPKTYHHHPHKGPRQDFRTQRPQQAIQKQEPQLAQPQQELQKEEIRNVEPQQELQKEQLQLAQPQQVEQQQAQQKEEIQSVEPQQEEQKQEPQLEQQTEEQQAETKPVKASSTPVKRTSYGPRKSTRTSRTTKR
ncbi:MAG TPA: Rne/Rng family ribonuclease [Candidatus Gastranaerophilales bacterium]|nr:Rne/Rng family ribonuclease [Candidatus Gastranaerophilales bacterium]